MNSIPAPMQRFMNLADNKSEDFKSYLSSPQSSTVYQEFFNPQLQSFQT